MPDVNIDVTQSTPDVNISVTDPQSISLDLTTGTPGPQGPPGPVVDHNVLTARSAADAHPTSAITGLDAALLAVTVAIGAIQVDVSAIEGDVLSLQTSVSTLQSQMTTAQGDITSLQNGRVEGRGNGTANRVAYWTDANTIGSDSAFTFASGILRVGNVRSSSDVARIDDSLAVGPNLSGSSLGTAFVLVGAGISTTDATGALSRTVAMGSDLAVPGSTGGANAIFGRASSIASGASGMLALASDRTGITGNNGIAIVRGGASTINLQNGILVGSATGQVGNFGAGYVVGLGHGLTVNAAQGIAIGRDAAVNSGHTNAIALGYGAISTASNRFTLATGIEIQAGAFASATLGMGLIAKTSGNVLADVTLGSGLSYSGGTLSATGLGGTVTSVALSVPAQFSVSGSPVTGAGTLSFSWVSQAANLVLASPDGSTGAPSFRALVAADIPGLDASKIISGTLDPSRLPPIALTTIQVVADQAARLALTNVEPGDAAKQTDTGQTFILSVLPASVNGNWVEIADLSPAWATITGTPTTLAGYGITDAQPLDSDLTAIAALSTTAYGRGFLTLADSTAAATYAGAIRGNPSGNAAEVMVWAAGNTARGYGNFLFDGSRLIVGEVANFNLNISIPGSLVSTASMYDAIFIGHNLGSVWDATPVGAVMIGNNLTTGSIGSESITSVGDGNDIHGQNNVVYGPYNEVGQIGSGSNHAVIVGYGNTVAAGLGYPAIVGTFNEAAHQGCVLLGDNISSGAAGQFLVGGLTPITTMRVGGNGTVSSPTDLLFQSTDSTGTNIVGGRLTIRGGIGTGNAADRGVEIRGYASASSGATVHTAYAYARVTGDGLEVYGASNTTGLQFWQHPGFQGIRIGGTSEGYVWEAASTAATASGTTQIGVMYANSTGSNNHVEWGRGLDRTARLARQVGGWVSSAFVAVGRDNSVTTADQTLFRIANRNPTATLALTGNARYFQIADYDTTTSTQTELVYVNAAREFITGGSCRVVLGGRGEVFGALSDSAGQDYAWRTVGQWGSNPGSVEAASLVNRPSVQGLTANSTATVGLAANRTSILTSNNLTSSRSVAGMAGWYEKGNLGVALGVGGALAISNYYGGYVGNLPALAAGVSLTNHYGIFIESPTRGASSNFCIYTTGTAPTRFGGDLFVGDDAGSGDTVVNIGANRSADGNAYIDIHAANGSYPDYATRMVRYSGPNSNFQIQQRGTGSLVLYTVEAASIEFTTSGSLRFSVDGTTGDLLSSASSGGNIKLLQTGKGLYLKEGANAVMGVATLVAGTVTVNTNKVTANSRIFLQAQDGASGPHALHITARTAGTSFTITSSSAGDTSTIAWVIIEPS